MATSAANPLASGDTAYLYRATIGTRGQDYYLRHFARFDGEGRAGTSWNWAAYWATFNWLAYRRMWGWALAYVGAVLGSALLIFGVGKLLFSYSDTSALLLFLLLLTVAFVVPGLYANAWYYTHCNDKISAVLRKTPEVRAAATVLAGLAPDNRRLLLLGLANAALLALLLSVPSWFQGADSALPQMATREERLGAGGQSGQVRELATLPVTGATAPVVRAPDVAATASAPTAVARAPAASVAVTPEAPRVAPAASAPAAPVTARAAVAGAPTLLNAADRSVAPPEREPAVPPARAPRPAAPVAVAESAPPVATAPRPARVAGAGSAPRQIYVWVIQVGAYAQEANAQKALEQVQGLGLDAGAESFESDKGKLMRVRVGPFARQAEADQAALRIKSLDLPVLVIRQRP